MNDGIDWKTNARIMLEMIINEEELPHGSLYLSDNYGKNGINGHSIYIWEPSYPPIRNEQQGKNKLVLTINEKKNGTLSLLIREIQKDDLFDFLPEDADVHITKSRQEAGFVEVLIKKDSPNLVEYLKQNTLYCLGNYESSATSFACCSQFIACSDARKCIHENKLYSKACLYRQNLDAGRIFYGKNKNVE